MADYFKDSFGNYEVTFTYKEPDNGKTYEFRKYVNSKKIKAIGGMYAIYCEEDLKIIFRKSEYLRDKSYKKFSEGNCIDWIDCGPEWPAVRSEITEDQIKYDCKILEKYIETQKIVYNLPSYIDKSKLTEEEFETLRKLIKKSLPSR